MLQRKKKKKKKKKNHQKLLSYHVSFLVPFLSFSSRSIQYPPTSDPLFVNLDRVEQPVRLLVSLRVGTHVRVARTARRRAALWITLHLRFVVVHDGTTEACIDDL